MNSIVPILIMSHGRSDRVITKSILPDAAICIPASQEADYRLHYPESEYVIHPDSVLGLPNKRQWVYEQFGDVFMIDDDISGVVDMSAYPRPDKLSGDRLVSVIERGFDTAKQLGVFLWGFTKAQNVMQFQPQQPFELNGRIPGLCMGLCKGGKFWLNGAGITTVDDEWVVALNAHFHRISFIDRRYGFVENRTNRKGGAGHIRTKSTEQRDVAIMLETFGPDIVKVVGEGDKDSKLSTGLGFSLRFPW